ncbi:hypothetical protein [Litorimonas sp. WD9-15]|uniref:tellurite resistance TerB family protein n=1 Tax=Litorimonas sp. WD9-15 TaxID=3418716 RepID=UPI003CFC08E4
MIQSEMNDILMVLAVGVFADKKIHSSEIEVFIRSVSRIRLSEYDVPKVSEAKALTWFEMNKDDIRERFNGPRSEFDAWLIPILKRVEDHADKEALLHLLNMIFLADREVHNSERAMMVLIKRVWNLE